MTSTSFYKVWQKLNEHTFELISKVGKECHMEITSRISDLESNFFGANGEFIRGIRGKEPSTIDFLDEKNTIIASTRMVKQFFMTYMLDIGEESYLVSADNFPFASITISQGSNELIRVEKDNRGEEEKLSYKITAPSYPLLLDCLVMQLFLPLLHVNKSSVTKYH